MRKYLALLFIIAFIASCSTGSISEKASDLWKKISPFSKDDEAAEQSKRLDELEAKIAGAGRPSDKTKTLVASGHPEYPPAMWREGEQIVGVGPEILKIIFEESEIAVDSTYQGSWEQVKESAKEGDIDVIAGIYSTEERKKYLDYSIPYMKDAVVIFTAKGKAFPYAKWDDLIGKRGTAVVGDSFGREFDNFSTKKLTVTEFVTVEESFKKLLSGEVDYFLSALYLGLFEAERLGLSDKVEYLPTYVMENDLCIAVSKKSKYRTLLANINEKLAKLIKDGAIEKLIDEKTKGYKASTK